MNVIVAGGSGLIGQSLTAALVENGHKVWVLTRNPTSIQLPWGVEPVPWDGKTTQGWSDLVSQADAVVNLAGANIGDLPWTNERKELIRSSRVEVGQAITNAIRDSQHRPKVFLQASGTNYYGTHEDDRLNEQSTAGSDFVADVAKDWEASTQPVEDLGLRRVVIRSGAVLTPEGGMLKRFLYPFQMYMGGAMGSGQQWISWIHIRDEVNAIRFLLENEEANGPFNLTAPNPVTNETFGRTLADILGRPFWAPIPAFAIRLLYGELSMMVLEGQRVLPERLLEMGFNFTFPSLRSALEDLLNPEPEIVKAQP